METMACTVTELYDAVITDCRYMQEALQWMLRLACSSKKLLMTSAWGLPARSSAAATCAGISDGTSAGSCASSVSCTPASSLRHQQMPKQSVQCNTSDDYKPGAAGMF